MEIKPVNGSAIVALYGVYDADATIIGEVSYWIGARLGIRHCSLCDITHSLFREKSEWRLNQRLLEQEYGVNFQTFHRDDAPDAVRELASGAYPIVISQDSAGAFTLFMNNDEISKCEASAQRFLEAIIARLS